jgi:hypothetical protein
MPAPIDHDRRALLESGKVPDQVLNRAAIGAVAAALERGVSGVQAGPIIRQAYRGCSSSQAWAG